jgi:hypothetical protein
MPRLLRDEEQNFTTEMCLHPPVSAGRCRHVYYPIKILIFQSDQSGSGILSIDQGLQLQ